MRLSLLAAVLLCAGASQATAQVAVLHIRIVEGESAIFQPGAHVNHPIAVQVTDETGMPVGGAAVSFHLPEDGPGGQFPTGMHDDIALTDYRGRATLRSFTLNRTPGPFQVRIVAGYEQARASIYCKQFIAGRTGATTPAAPSVSHSGWKWVAIAAIACAGAAGGVLVAGRSSARTSNPTPPATTPATPTLGVSPPTITVGKQ